MTAGLSSFLTLIFVFFALFAAMDEFCTKNEGARGRGLTPPPLALRQRSCYDLNAMLTGTMAAVVDPVGVNAPELGSMWNWTIESPFCPIA